VVSELGQSIRRVRASLHGAAVVREWLECDVAEFNSYGRVYPAKPARRHKVGVVFSGGGSLGAVQVGQLRALLDHGVVPDLVVGSSIGALNAAAFAQNPTREGVAALEQIWKRAARTNTVFGYSKAGEIMRFALRRPSTRPAHCVR
jgi:predicted acylesterase/phospholipase RssA